jgi:hypothetical protein
MNTLLEKEIYFLLDAKRKIVFIYPFERALILHIMISIFIECIQ